MNQVRDYLHQKCCLIELLLVTIYLFFASPKALFTKKGFGGLPPVATTTPEQVAAAASWAAASVFSSDLTETIRELKTTGNGKPIVALGGGGFMQSLIATGLIDEYHLAIHPVALGAGLPIFNAPLELQLTDLKRFPRGIVVHVYRGVQ
ncbi:dihydrofolate reductase family protein [Chitinophaga sp. Cy-1792]|uniref:dihydrofolate reductase family protein n=1 Tax=Chitinophaga sp. Cy-1792 TaxID=2608339 RepID=UPI001F04C824|nr:dihydrofolate reductase family protein [Chitinophaga sp. Cy-1792]